MDTKRLMYYCTIGEQGKISRAAKILNISQPPLSQRLKELEDELGVELIIRQGHAWQVTEAGKVLYEGARQALNQLTEIPTEVRNAAASRIVHNASRRLSPHAGSSGIRHGSRFHLRIVLPRSFGR